MIARTLCVIAVAMVLAACAASRVTPKADWYQDHFGNTPSDQFLLPGYRPGLIESIGTLASDGDMDGPRQFASEVCDPWGGYWSANRPGTNDDHGNQWRQISAPYFQKQLDENQHYLFGRVDDDLITRSGLWAISLSSGGGAPSSNQGGGQQGAGQQGGGALAAASPSGSTTGQGAGATNSGQGGGSGGGLSVSLVPISGTGTKTTVMTQPAVGNVNGKPATLFQQVATPVAGATTIKDTNGNTYSQVAAGQTTTATTETTTTTKPTPETLIGVTKCSLKVIQVAVNICIHRGSNRNAFNDFMNSSLGSGVAIGGMAAGIAALARESGKQTAVIGGGAAAATALLGGLQKIQLPSAGQAQISSVTTSGLQYLVFDDLLTWPLNTDNPAIPKIYEPDPSDWDGDDSDGDLKAKKDNTTIGNLWAYENSYAHLFDAAISGCTVASQ